MEVAQWLYSLHNRIYFPNLILSGISPLTESDQGSPLTDLVHPSMDILEQFAAGSQPTFSIVSNEQYLAELTSNSSVRNTALLPPQFLVSLSYKPANNTVLRLISLIQLENNPSPQDNPSSTLGNAEDTSTSRSATEAQLLGSVVFSSSVTLVQSEGYLELWDSLSHSDYHSVDLIVTRGELHVCVDGELRPAVQLWPSNPTQSLQLSFSPHLHSVTSVVSGNNVLSDGVCYCLLRT